MKKDILQLLAQNARMSVKEMSERLNASVDIISQQIHELEEEGVIKGYHAILSESAFPENLVKAVIQVQTRPEREDGFDRIAKRVARFPEVESVYLVSGGHDLQLIVTGKTLQEVAFFVSSKLSSMDGVISTSTHFLLKKYKESNVILYEEEMPNERLSITP